MAKVQADVYWINATVSEGTLKTVDLLGRFATLLRKLVEADAHASNRNDLFELIGAADVMTVLLELDEANQSVEDVAESFVEKLIEALDDAAPEGCTFGTHEGDGALFGFWPTGEEED